MSFFDLYRPFIEATQRMQEIEKNESQSILRDPNPEYQQMTIFDLMNKAANEDVSTSDIDDMIRVLQDKKRAIEEEERRKREILDYF